MPYGMQLCHRWATFWGGGLYNQQISTIGPTVLSNQSSCLYNLPPVGHRWTNSDFCSRWQGAIIRDLGTLSKNLFNNLCVSNNETSVSP